MDGTKTATAAIVKAAGTPGSESLTEGQFEAIVSVFGNKDSVGDVVMPGAFKADIDRWAASGDRIPVIFSHDWGTLTSHVGSVVKAEERPEGLWVLAEIENRDINPQAELLYRLLKGRRIKQFSFAYDVVEGGWGKRDDEDVYELRQLKVHEVGPCLLGANQETELLAVKAQETATAAKAGRVLSQKNYEQIAAAHTALGEVLAAAEPEKAATVNIVLDGKTVAQSVARVIKDAAPQTPEPSGSGSTDEPSQAEKPATQDETPDGAKSSEPADSAARRALQVSVLFAN
ncbi:MAG: phage prohead protease [Thermoleophilia bacterium]|nr:phage prohead protease [Thermoleophilia bacterium]